METVKWKLSNVVIRSKERSPSLRRRAADFVHHRALYRACGRLRPCPSVAMRKQRPCHTAGDGSPTIAIRGAQPFTGGSHFWARRQPVAQRSAAKRLTPGEIDVVLDLFRDAALKPAPRASLAHQQSWSSSAE